MTLFKVNNYDSSIENWKDRIERCIDRLNFLALYSINKDLVIQAICLSLRENRLVKPEDDETLEDKVGEAVKNISGSLWAGTRELDIYTRALRQKMAELVKNNEAQRTLEEIISLNNWRRK